MFDSASRTPARSVDAFLKFYEDVTGALGAHVPTVIVPGNHDRRKLGLIGPFRREPFLLLRKSLGSKAFVHGSAVPFLALAPRTGLKAPHPARAGQMVFGSIQPAAFGALSE